VAYEITASVYINGEYYEKTETKPTLKKANDLATKWVTKEFVVTREVEGKILTTYVGSQHVSHVDIEEIP